MSDKDYSELCKQLEEFKEFTKRRFDELSMEVNATSQQIDMNEDTIATRFSDIVGVLHSISHRGEGVENSTSHNTGVELENVVDMTEEAANTILDAAGRIGSLLSKEKTNWDDPDMRALALDAINEQVEGIFIACSFQDLTSQRIRETLGNLRGIEDRLNNTLDRIGIQVDPKEAAAASMPNEAPKNQEDIDAMFTDSKKESN